MGLLHAITRRREPLTTGTVPCACGCGVLISPVSYRHAVRYVAGHQNKVAVNRRDAVVNHMRFEVYKDKSGKWRWHAVAANKNILADSGQGYTKKGGAKSAAKNFIYQIQDGKAVVGE